MLVVFKHALDVCQIKFCEGGPVVQRTVNAGFINDVECAFVFQSVSDIIFYIYRFI